MEKEIFFEQFHVSRAGAMAKVSDDHADESMCVERLTAPRPGKVAPRPISPEEVRQHGGRDGGSFWAVIDSFVVDCSEFVDAHPGGLRKLLSADSAAAGATGAAFGFSFSRGRNAHFPATGKAFREGVQRYLSGGRGAAEPFLPAVDVAFASYGRVTILGRLEGT